MWAYRNSHGIVTRVMPRFRRSEFVLAAYFTYAAVVACSLHLAAPIALTTVCVNAVVLAALFGFASAKQAPWISAARDFFPLPLVLLAYREMGWFARPITEHSLEQGWLAIDHAVVPTLRWLVELAGPVFPSILEIAYSLATPTPMLCIAILYATGNQQRMDRFWFSFLVGAFTSYALFPYFPSEPPRTIFPLDNLPSYHTVFRQLNLEILGTHGIHTSVFPSAHVSAEFGAAIGMYNALAERRWAWGTFVVLACLITVATVYGRYHYAVDAIAGLGVSAFTWWFTRQKHS